ncbi:MAG: quinoprotein dehydrogenase-associated SoxYZ-like carrier, partial [Methyloprofundus sp.]|nr:quinoprotein dehydrogenase-associated SoxYZ-like carrier [Methyloprofundus sp.]
MNIQPVFSLLLLFSISNFTFAAKNEVRWTQVLQPQYFSGKVIQEGNGIIRLTSPVRAEDPAL